MDSDADDEEYDGPVAEEAEDIDTRQESGGMLSAEDALRQGELAEGVRKIKVRLISYICVSSCHLTPAIES